MAINKTAAIYLNYANPDQPIFLEPTSAVLARGMAGSSSDAVDLSIYWVTNPGASPSYSIPEVTDTVIFSAKKRPSDTGLIYEVTNWTRVTDSPAHYTGFLDLGVASEFWDSDSQTEKTITAQIIVRNADNTRRDTWIFPLRVKRGDFGSETPPNTLVPYLDVTAARGIFVAYDEAQTLTTEQKAQARANIGASSGSSFDPASPGPIGGTTPDTASFTTTTTDGLVVSTTVSRGGTVLGMSATDGRSQEWKDGGGTVVGYVTKDGDASYQSISSNSTISATDEMRSGSFVNTNDSFSVDGAGNVVGVSFSGPLTGNASTATALQTARTIFGQSFNGTGDVTGTVTTPTVQADTSAGGSLKSNNGTTCLSWGGGGGGNVTAVTLAVTADSFTLGGITVTKPAASGTIVTLTGTETLTNKTLTSPTLTTPALGTATSGDLRNCSAATTSLAGVITLATSAQSQTGLSTSLAVTPSALASRLMDPCFIPMSAAVMRSFTSGTGYALDSSKLATTTFTSTAGVGYSIASIGYPGLEGIGQPGVDRLIINFSKRIEISGAATLWTGYAGDANSTGRLMLGGKVTVTGGAPSSRAIGLSVAGAGANVFLNVHNGTSLATVDTGFAPSLNTPFSFRIISDGAGNVSLSINGGTAVTSSAGPTGNSASGACFLSMVEGVSGNTTKFLFSLLHGWIYIAP